MSEYDHTTNRASKSQSNHTVYNL